MIRRMCGKFIRTVVYCVLVQLCPAVCSPISVVLNECLDSVFRLDALALSVIATATWRGGWVAGWLSHSGIVSKPLNLSENFFDHLKAPSL